MITENAPDKIQKYNAMGLHYNIAAEAIYRFRSQCDDFFSEEFLKYLVAGLISFDMERMMGKGANYKYDIAQGGFATRLFNKLQLVRGHFDGLLNLSLVDADLENIEVQIQSGYVILAEGGINSLSEKQKDFHVGAAKIMHFLNPSLFLIIDSNAARAFRREHEISYRDTTQPGYTAARYIQCLHVARQEIIDYGTDNFRALEPATPLMRIFDKLSFITGNSA